MGRTADAAKADHNLITSQWSFRNKAVNGDFSIWQRGTSFSSPASASYTADQWRVHYDGSGAFTVSMVASDNPDRRAGLRWEQTGAVTGGTYRVLQQPMESVRTLAGRRVTVSFKAKATGFTSLPIYLSQVFGTGGSPSAAVDTTAGTVTLDGTLKPYSVTVDVPSIAGKTLGSNYDDYLALSFNLPTSGTFDFHVEDVQVEDGEFATPFEDLPRDIAFSRCARFFRSSLSGACGTPVVVKVNASANYNGSIPDTVHFTPMRRVPTVTVYPGGSRANPGNVLVNGVSNSASFMKTEGPAQVVFWNDAALSSAGDYFTCHLDVDACY